MTLSDNVAVNAAITDGWESPQRRPRTSADVRPGEGAQPGHGNRDGRQRRKRLRR